MGHRCCSKQKVKRGLWSPEEDEKLLNFVTSHGHPSWSSVPRLAGLQRCGKSCRLRWINYLRPDLKRGSFTEEEERTIIEVHRILGNRWAQIAKHLPGRTDNEVKNFWNSCIKKKLLSQGLDPNTHNLLPPRKHASSTSTSTAPKSNTTFSIISNTNASQSSNNKISPKKKQSSEVFTVNNIRPSNNKNISSGPSFTVPGEIAHKKDVATNNLAMVSPYLPHEVEVLECLDPPSSMFSSTSCLDPLQHGFGLMDEASMWVDSGLEKATQFDDHQQQQHITGEGVVAQMSCAAHHPDEHLQLQEINVAMDEADELQTLKRLQMGGQGFDHLAPFSNNGGSGFDFGFGDYDTILQSGMYSMDQVAWDIAN